MRFALLLVVAASFAATASAAPPQAGTLVPGVSLGDLRLGATEAQVERAWGRAYGRCTRCERETWYFNYFAFQPRGAGVEFRGGRAVAIFTIYEPIGWRTTSGLALGEPAARVTAAYRSLERRDCGDYYALLRRRATSVTAFYILDGKLWAFGLSRAGVPVCR